MVIIFGLMCGLALGLTGGGGAIITVPLLVYGLHTPIEQAVTISLFVVGFTALAGVLPAWRWQYLEKRIALIVATSGILFAPLGTYFTAFFAPQALLSSFGALMMCVSFLLYFKSSSLAFFGSATASGGHSYTPYHTDKKSKKSLPLLILTGAMTGFLTGLFGVGGGFLIVPALILMVMLPVERAIATSLFIIFLISLSGIISHVHQQALDWSIVCLFLVGSVFGVSIGAYVSRGLKTASLQRGFALFIGFLGLAIVFKSSGIVVG